VGASDGLPVGLQIVGRRGEDGLVLRAARAFERVFPWSYDGLDLV
jgi:Asp-tRNA(Asn)/Glu-tRNA(Gln) amidotransferase A subunit family amidase